MARIKDPNGNIFDPNSQTFIQELMLANPGMTEDIARQYQAIGLTETEIADDDELLSLCPHGGSIEDLRHVANHINMAANILRGIEVAFPTANTSIRLMQNQLDLIWCSVIGMPPQFLGPHKDEMEQESDDIIEIIGPRI